MGACLTARPTIHTDMENKERNLVNGYIRQKLWNNNKDNTLFYNTPPLIESLCLLYYQIFDIHLSTPNDYLYKEWFDVNQTKKCVQFQVKANNDAHIALGNIKAHKSKHWEIVISGWNNTCSVMRKKNQGHHYVVKQGAQLDKNQYKSFWIQWDEDGYLTVGKGDAVDEGEELMKYAYDKQIPINYMSVCTGWGSTGQWIIVL